MFRKIHSKRNPEDTLYASIRQEFSVYFDLGRVRLLAFFKRYPKPVFASMVLIMLCSIALCLTVFKAEKPPKKAVAVSLAAQGEGFSAILTRVQALQESMAVKQEISALIEKDSLSSADSARLGKAIDRFHQLTITLDQYEAH